MTQKDAEGPRNAQMARSGALIGAAVLTLGVHTLAAQTVRGTVVDSATAQPLASVSVELTDTASQVVARASTDNAGAFVLQAPAPGAYRMRVHRIGYREFESAMVLKSQGESTLPLRLATVPVELEPVAVTGNAEPYLQTSGFYQRKLEGVGHFLDPPVVEKLASKARLIGDIFDHIPGVRMTVAAGSGGIRVPHLRGCTRISGHGQDRDTYPRIYLDGLKVQKDVFAWLLPSDILAVEIYNGPAQIPLLYGGTSTPCGVILIWTKH